jgi:hypothetical protein
MTERPMPEREPKKNTTIEVRISDEAKAAFLERCQVQGHSASDALRDFMAAYVHGPKAARSSWTEKGLTMLKSPAAAMSALAGAALISAAVLLGSPPAAADDVELAFEIGINKPGDNQRVEAAINLDYGRPEVFRLPASRDEAGAYFYEVSVLATPCAEADRCAADNVLVDVVIRREGAAEAVIAEPRLLAKYGRGAAVSVGASEGVSVRVEIHAARVRPPAEDS